MIGWQFHKQLGEFKLMQAGQEYAHQEANSLGRNCFKQVAV